MAWLVFPACEVLIFSIAVNPRILGWVSRSYSSGAPGGIGGKIVTYLFQHNLLLYGDQFIAPILPLAFRLFIHTNSSCWNVDTT